MNQKLTSGLDSFESALLAELKTVVAAAAEPSPAPVPPFARRAAPRRPNRWRASAAALAAAALAVALLVQGRWPTPAYAVTGRNDGEVKVRVNRLEGADGLERALGEHGIAADITYLPQSKRCAPGRYASRPSPGLMLTVSSDWFEVTIPPGAVGKDDTFVLSASVVPFQNGFNASVDFDVAQGAVAPCRAVGAR